MTEVSKKLIKYLEWARCWGCGRRNPVEVNESEYKVGRKVYHLIYVTCSRCKNIRIKFVRYRFKGRYVWASWVHHYDKGLQNKCGISCFRFSNPIASSRDYKEPKETRGRPRHYDPRQIDHALMQLLGSLILSTHVRWGKKYGLDTMRVTEHLNHLFPELKVSRAYVLRRLTDLEIRGLARKQRRLGKWFWSAEKWDIVGDCASFEEFREDVSRWKDVNRYVHKHPFDLQDLERYSPKELLDLYRAWIEGLEPIEREALKLSVKDGKWGRGTKQLKTIIKDYEGGYRVDRTTLPDTPFYPHHIDLDPYITKMRKKIERREKGFKDAVIM